VSNSPSGRPHCWQSIAALELLRRRVARPGPRGKRLTFPIAFAVYGTLTQLASERWKNGGRDGFEATRPEIAERAGVSDKSVDDYCKVLVEIGLLRVQRCRHGGLNLPSRYVLPDPVAEPAPSGELSTPPPNSARHPRTQHATVANVARDGGELSTPVVKEVQLEEPQEQSPLRSASGRGGEAQPEQLPLSPAVDVQAPSPSSAAPPSPDSRAERELFDYWQQRCGHSQAKATRGRLAKVRARLREGYTVEQIHRAIDGAAIGAFVNDAGKRFDDLELICRSGEKLESFIDRATGSNGRPPGAPVRSSDLGAALRGRTGERL
jgi:hypothetical protein